MSSLNLKAKNHFNKKKYKNLLDVCIAITNLFTILKLNMHISNGHVLFLEIVKKTTNKCPKVWVKCTYGTKLMGVFMLYKF